MPGEGPLTHISVDVTFLEMRTLPVRQRGKMPPGWSLEHNVRFSTDEYRALYMSVGREWCWWMRLALPDADLFAILNRPETYITVLREGTAVRGFYELGQTYGRRGANLSYFGLFPIAVGRGVGREFLRCAIDEAWSLSGGGKITVNTCTADHPRALPLYLSEGFSVVRVVQENWNIPPELNLRKPLHLC